MQLGCETLALDVAGVNDDQDTVRENICDNYRGSPPDIVKDAHCPSPENALDEHNEERNETIQ